MIGDLPIKFSPSFRYLGILIDVKWSFSYHFQFIIEKTGRVVRALNRLMPNLRGPDERLRRLYANTVMSVILYGAPVWGDVFATSKLQPALYSLQRTVAQRVISVYRSVSSNAALLLARLPPLKFVATMRKRIFDQIKARRGRESLARNEKKD